MIHFYELSQLDAAQRARLLRRAEVQIDDLIEYVRPIVRAVRDRGDEALIEFMERFDHVQLTPDRFRIEREAIERAHTLLDKDIHAAIEYAVRNVRTFHERQMPHEQWFTEVAPGIMAGEKITPISSVGLYVPRGKGAFPSVMYMLATPASIAGVPRIVVCTPPGPDGEVDPASLVAADLCGVHEIYRLGGAHAIAALAYGTESIARVHKITSPGSPYVSAAKRLLYGTVDIGLPAGPSEAILLADESADPELVARAGFEGPDGTGGIILTRTMSEAIEFVNEFAPEHLEVLVREPFAILSNLKNAGEILIGPYTPICTGNYAIGTNAILPTGGFAHTFSCTSVFDFLKRTGLAYLTAEGYAALSETTRRLAEFEGFPAHANAVTERRAPLPRSSKTLQ